MTAQFLNDRYHNRKQAAKFLTECGFPTTPSTLATKACRGGGPPYFMYGKSAIYEENDLIAWATTNQTLAAKTATERRTLGRRIAESSKVEAA